MLDVLVVGAGPAGLYVGIQGGMMGLNGRIIETNSQPGGSPQFLYPNKIINNFPGFVKIHGMEIAERLFAQYKVFEDSFPITFNAEVLSYSGSDGNFKINLSNGEEVMARKIIIASGTGKFSSRKGDFKNDNSIKILHNIGDINNYVNKEIVVLGGGDTACDAALQFINITPNVTLIHRRAEFRAVKNSLNQIMKSKINVIKSRLVKEIKNKKIILDNGDILNADIVFIGYGSDIEKNSFDWKVQTKVGKIVVENNKTSVNGIYAIGSICTYKNRLNIITIAMAEAASIVNEIQKDLNLEHVLGY